MSTITIRFGSEGPQHDPYHYYELTVTRANGDEVTWHDGLGRWVVARGGDLCVEMDERNTKPEQMHRLFEMVAGVSVEHARKAHRRLRSRCQKCGCRETRTASGYPGESFELCAKCGHVVDSHFDRSAIE